MVKTCKIGSYNLETLYTYICEPSYFANPVLTLVCAATAQLDLSLNPI